jgi:transposase
MFFAELGEERRGRITHVTCDGAEWIHDTVRSRCEKAEVCLDAFHIVAWANDAVDSVRRELWNEQRTSGDKQLAGEVKGTRWALLKNPENLTGRQADALAQLEADNSDLYRAYLLKEQLRLLLRQPAEKAIPLLDGWIQWAAASGLAAFEKVAKTIARQRSAVESHAPPRPDQRTRRIRQRQDPAHTAARLRLPRPVRIDSTGSAHPLRTLPPATRKRPAVTHTYVTRPQKKR